MTLRVDDVIHLLIFVSLLLVFVITYCLFRTCIPYKKVALQIELFTYAREGAWWRFRLQYAVFRGKGWSIYHGKPFCYSFKKRYRFHLER